MEKKPITPEEIKQFREIEEERIRFLDAEIAALSPQVKHQLTLQLNKIATQTFKEFLTKARQWKIIREPEKPLRITIGIRSSSEVRASYNGRIMMGSASRENSYIILLEHLIFAPKEVVRCIVTHELFHIFYPYSVNKTLPNGIETNIKHDYEESVLVEETWVRQMEARFCGNIPYLAIWEESVSLGKHDWKAMYAIIKKTYIQANP